MRSLPESTCTLTHAVKHGSTELLHPVQRIKRVGGIGPDKRNMAHFVAAVIGLQSMPFRAVKECL